MQMNDGGAPGGAGQGDGAKPSGAAALLADAGGEAPPAGGEGQGDGGGVPWWQGDGFGVSNEKPDPDALSDAEWLNNKKFGSFGDMLKSARALEQRLGGERVPVVKGADDKEGLALFAKAMGVPDKPDGYELKLADGYDQDFVGGFRNIAHEAALAPWQVQKVVDWFEKTTGADAEANADKARAELQGEWRDSYKQNMALSQRALTAMGLTPDDLNAMAVGMGLAPATKLMAKLGRMLGEDGGMAGDGNGGSGQMTLEAALARKAEIIANKAESEALWNGTASPALKKEWDDIAAIEAAAAERRRAA